jgi:hypothetical protein
MADKVEHGRTVGWPHVPFTFGRSTGRQGMHANVPVDTVLQATFSPFFFAARCGALRWCGGIYCQAEVAVAVAVAMVVA